MVTWVSGTYTISSGGTYGPTQISANRQVTPTAPKNSFASAAVYVNTTSPVTIEGVSLQSAVGGTPCIYGIPGASITILNCNLDAYVSNGQTCYFDATSALSPSITMQNNYIHGGTVRIGPSGGAQAQLRSFTFQYNIVQDIYGRLASLSDSLRQCIQISDIYGPGIEIGWNQLVNAYGTSSVEDMLAFYADSGLRCGGTAASRAQVHDNIFDGQWPSPVATGNDTGSGVITDFYGNSPTGGFIDIHDNTFVAVMNGGPCPSSGHSVHTYNNRIAVSGLKPDGTAAPVSTNANGVSIYSGNAGSATTAWNGVEGSGGWGDMTSTNNVSGLQRTHVAGNRSDYWYENASFDPVTSSGNTSYGGSGSYLIGLADEQNERNLWATKVSNAGLTIGPATTSAVSFTATVTDPTTGLTGQLSSTFNVA